ncbi:hypothetical protein STEG23_016663, partial [Scotinomys teguina]
MVCNLAYIGKLDELKECILANKSLVTRTDQDSRTPLHWACSAGHTEIVEFLLQLGVPVNDKDDAGRSPLHIAASAGQDEIVKALLVEGAQVNAVNQNDCTPLHYAASKNRHEIAVMLLEGGANPDAKDHYEATAMHRAAAKGFTCLRQLNSANNYPDSLFQHLSGIQNLDFPHTSESQTLSRKGQASHGYQPAMAFQAAVRLDSSFLIEAGRGNPVEGKALKSRCHDFLNTKDLADNVHRAHLDSVTPLAPFGSHRVNAESFCIETETVQVATRGELNLGEAKASVANAVRMLREKPWSRRSKLTTQKGVTGKYLPSVLTEVGDKAYYKVSKVKSGYDGAVTGVSGTKTTGQQFALKVFPVNTQLPGLSEFPDY